MADAFAYAGWLILVGDHIENAAEAIRIYRDKDVVEKGFLRSKRSLGLDRLWMHGDGLVPRTSSSGATLNLATCEVSDQASVHSWQAMGKLRIQKVDGRRILFSLTKRQKQIYATFGISPPV